MAREATRRGPLALAAALVLAGPLLLAAPASGTAAVRSAPIAVDISVSTSVAGQPSAVQVRVNRGRIAKVQVSSDGHVSGRDWILQGRVASGPITWRTAGMHQLVATVSLRTGRVVTGRLTVRVGEAAPAVPSPSASPTAVASPSTSDAGFTLIYLYPAGTAPVEGRTSAIAHEAQVVDAWYAGQLSGLSPRFAVDASGAPAVGVVAADLDSAALAASADVVSTLISGWRASGLISANAVPVVYVEGRQANDRACGWTSHGRSPYIVIPMDNCDIHPTPDSRFPFGASYLLAHEMLHAFGAVSDSAPHSDGTGHVNDDPRDLNYFGHLPRDWANLTVDPGHDDYYLTGRTDLVNIESSPLLE